jgi:hypothetical protein
MNKFQRTKQHKKLKITYAIFVDGETEMWYLQQMKSTEESLNNVDLEPKLVKRASLDEKINTIKSKIGIYDKIFWIIDFDDFFKQEQDKKGKIQELKNKIQKLKNDFPQIEVLFNVPCLEYWFLLHFVSSSKFASKCSTTEKALKKYIPDYEKTEKYFKNPRLNIYQRLREKLGLACKNAKNLDRFSFDDYETAKAELYVIFEALNFF